MQRFTPKVDLDVTGYSLAHNQNTQFANVAAYRSDTRVHTDIVPAV